MREEEKAALITEEALAKRANWEYCAPNAYEQVDWQVVALIDEVRRLRELLADKEGETDEEKKVF